MFPRLLEHPVYYLTVMQASKLNSVGNIKSSTRTRTYQCRIISANNSIGQIKTYFSNKRNEKQVRKT